MPAAKELLAKPRPRGPLTVDELRLLSVAYSILAMSSGIQDRIINEYFQKHVRHNPRFRVWALRIKASSSVSRRVFHVHVFWRFAGSHVFENFWIMETLSVLVQVVISMLKVRFGEDSQVG